MENKNESCFTHVRTDLLKLVPENARRILDIGCSDGAFGKQIKELNNNAEVIGIEIDEIASRKAAQNLDRVITGDIEKISLPFSENYFDCIIIGDVLEHLIDPWKAVQSLRYFLKGGGLFISSIPNIRYYKALIRLSLGYWDYTEGGIFDKSHLRFFCLVNIKELFLNSGFKIEHIGRNKVSARGFRILNYILLNRLKDFLTYQYYIVARKEPNPLQAAQRQIKQF